MKYLDTSQFKADLKAHNELLQEDPEHIELSEDGSYSLVPIAFLEPDLNEIYNGIIEIIIKEQKDIFGAICMVIDLRVFHPVCEFWQTFSGTAAVQIINETESEYRGAVNVSRLETMQTAVAKCYIECLKNAAKKIGNRFGKNLNRKNTPKNLTNVTNETKELVTKIDRIKKERATKKAAVKAGTMAKRAKIQLP